MERACRAGWWAGLAAVLQCAVAVIGLMGCYDENCTLRHTCPYLDEEPACPADPATAAGGEVPGRCGVWVSASLGADTSDGSPEAPVATLTHAITKAASGPRRVFACAEVFDEAVQLPAGVSLHGGFHCADHDWRYLADDAKTTLTAPANQIPLTLKGPAGAAPSIVTDMQVKAKNATDRGGSSIAVLALAEARADVRRSTFESGNGADGADGDNGEHLSFSAKSGLLGENGWAACTGNVGFGGHMVALDCEDDASFGGVGGDGGQLVANPGDDGEVAPASNPQGLGIGGKGEDLAAGLFCTPGLGGAAGKEGDPGVGGAWPPRLTASGYVGVWGGNGQRGKAGQGGGGGGASAGTAACGAASAHGGAGGGSGGTGGCGGKGGRGGQPGGASIALATLTDALVFSEVDLISGNGGRGGAGGMPQQGGQGGLPGIGGAGWPAVGGPNPGCVGGAGGYGGDGGHAGGGLGGPSLPLAYAGAQPGLGGLDFSIGDAGAGGPGSDASLGFTAGEAGRRGPFDALLP